MPGLCSAVLLLLLLLQGACAVFTPTAWHSARQSPSGFVHHTQTNKRRQTPTSQRAPSIEESRKAIDQDSVWIVELNEGADVQALDDLQKRGLNVSQHSSIAHATFSRLLQETADGDGDFSIKIQYTDSPDVFHGASVQLKDSKLADKVAQMSIVKNIWQSRKIFHPAREQLLSQNHVSKRDADSSNQQTYNPHVMMGVDYAHKRGLKGKGVFVAAVDSGVDYNHPDLGGCFGSGCKVAHGHAFVGDSLSDSNFQANEDPYANCLGAVHGTMISGLIAANPSDTGFVGVAPEATLGMYRIFDCDLSSTEDVLISGIMKAHADGADVISLSANVGIGGFADDPLSAIVDRVVAKGTFVAVATGNYGDQGAFYLPAPATAANALKVGSLEPKQWTQFTATTNTGREIDYYGSHSYGNGTFDVYVNTLDTSATSDGCSALPSDTPNLQGQVAVFRRGGCALVDKATNALAFNASGVFVYSQEGDPVTYDDGIYDGFEEGNLGLISPEDGAFLVQQAQDGQTVTLTFEEHLTNVENVDSSGISSFSQYGPTYELRTAPSVMTPGSYLLSTAPLDLGAYTVQTGTSFATPLAAGAVAVLLASQRELGLAHEPASLLQQIVTSAKPVGLNERFVSVSQQGGGLLRLDIALMSQTGLDTSFLAINDTQHFQAEHTFTVTNKESQSIVYSISNLMSLTNFPYAQGSIYPRLEPLTYHRAASAVVAPSEFRLDVGQSQTISVTFSMPPGLPASAFPIYSGYVRVKPAYGPALQIPYLGLSASTKDLNVIDTGSKLFGFDLPVVVNATGNLILTQTAFSMADSSHIPYLYYRFTASSRQVYIEVVAASDSAKTDDSLVVLKNSRYVGRNPLNSDHDSFDSTYEYASWDGTLADGEAAPNGNYQIRLRFVYSGAQSLGPVKTLLKLINGVAYRALKITGDRDQTNDYEYWVSPIIQVDRDQ